MRDDEIVVIMGLVIAICCGAMKIANEAGIIIGRISFPNSETRQRQRQRERESGSNRPKARRKLHRELGS